MSEQPSIPLNGGGEPAHMGKKAEKKAAKAAKVKPAPPPEDLVTASPAQAPPLEDVVKAAARAARPAPVEPEPAASTPPEPDSLDPMQLIGPEIRAQLETLSANLTRAAIASQGLMAETALRQAEGPGGMSVDPFHVSSALTQVVGQMAAHPDKLMRAQADLFARYVNLWQSASSRAMGAQAGEPAAQPDKGDKRFADPDWSQNPVFDVVKQSYLLTSEWLNALVADVQGVDPLEKRRVEFFTKMLTDAMSPANFLMSNPVALREAVNTKGESLVRGLENFTADLNRGGGRLAISQTDYQQFKIGENVATAPGKVIFQNELFQLIQYSPSTDEAHKTPLLIFPPWINKFYIMDLRPENSMIRWLVSEGFSVFLVSWVNPDHTLANKTFEDYMIDGVYTAVEAVTRHCGVEKVNTVGYCIGGTMLGSSLAHMAAKGYEKIGSATFFAAQQDFSEAGDLLLFSNEEWLKDLEKQMDAHGGVLPGEAMADTFNMLRANDLIWSFFQNNYLLGKEPKPFDLLFWNSDQTRMPKTLHMYYLRKFYMENALAKGTLEVAGVKLNLGDVKTPVYVQSSRDDHIAPARSVYKGAKLFGGPVTFTLAGSGHIAGVINAPAAQKYQHWTADHLPDALEGWQEGAVETKGSWWPHWSAWLKARSGELVPARDPSAGKFPPIEDAPGSYVKVRSTEGPAA